MFSLFSHGKELVMHQLYEAYHLQYKMCVLILKHPPSVMVNGTMCLSGIGIICFMQVRVNCDTYVMIMSDHVTPTGQFDFDDGDFILCECGGAPYGTSRAATS